MSAILRIRDPICSLQSQISRKTCLQPSVSAYSLQQPILPDPKTASNDSQTLPRADHRLLGGWQSSTLLGPFWTTWTRLCSFPSCTSAFLPQPFVVGSRLNLPCYNHSTTTTADHQHPSIHHTCTAYTTPRKQTVCQSTLISPKDNRSPRHDSNRGVIATICRCTCEEVPSGDSCKADVRSTQTDI